MDLAAAVFSQGPAVVQNIARDMKGGSIQEGRYNGYGSCPLFLTNEKLMLAEFKYDAVPDETFDGYGMPGMVFV